MRGAKPKEVIMAGPGVLKEEDVTLREIMRSIDKKVDYTVRERADSTLTLHLSLRGHDATVVVSLDDLKAAKQDLVRRHQVRQKIKAYRDHMDHSRYAKDVLGTKAAKLLRSSPRPESLPQRGFGRGPRR